MADTVDTTRETLGRYMVVELAPVQPPSGKTKRWLIRNKRSGAVLGSVGWYGSWRQYVFEPQSHADLAFSADCLDDISGFLKRANAEYNGKS